MKKILDSLKHHAKHPMIVTIVGCILTFIFSWILASNSTSAKYISYISVEDIDKYIETSLVKTGYVDASILDLETYGEKMDMIKTVFDAYSETIESTLFNLGVSSETLSSLSEEQRLSQLSERALSVYESYTENEEELENVSLENSDLKEKLDAQVDATVFGATLVIDGETMNEGNVVPNAVVSIDGNYYYSSGLLSTYLLSESLSFDSSDASVVYGKAQPEKTQLSWDSMVTNATGVTYYGIGDESFNMGTTSYNPGFVFTKEGSFYLHLGGKYSSISFTCGHIDDSDMVDTTLTIYQISEDGLSYDRELTSITLTGEMEPKEYTVELNYVNSIKIVLTGGNSWTKYGVADVYLYK